MPVVAPVIKAHCIPLGSGVGDFYSNAWEKKSCKSTNTRDGMTVFEMLKYPNKGNY